MELLDQLLRLPLAEQVSNFHGMVATLSLLVFGGIFALVLAYKNLRAESLWKPLSALLAVQAVLLGIVSAAGMVAYIAYRAPGGAREFLLSSPGTGWLHNIAFEYKEYICAVAPWLLMMVAFYVAVRLGRSLAENRAALRFILAATAASFLFVMLSASMAVLVAKVAPLEKFQAGTDLFGMGGNIVLLAAFLTGIVMWGFFCLIHFVFSKRKANPAGVNSLVSMMYGSAFGLTLLWILNMVQMAGKPARTSMTYLLTVGPYSGVVILSIAAILVATLIAWLVTRNLKKELSLKTAGWVLIACALLELVALFPPFVEMFIR